MRIFSDAIRIIFGVIDLTIYSLIEWVTQGIFDLAFLRVDAGLVETVRTRLYVILGVFMLFKLSISFMGYIVNPEQMTDKDKSKNIGGMITRTIVMLMFLILLPTLFTVVYRAQAVFLPVLPRVLLNSSENSGQIADTSQEGISQQSAANAQNMAVILLRAFYHPQYDAEKNYESVEGVKEIQSLKDFDTSVLDTHNFGVLAKPNYKYEYKIPFATIVGMITLYILVTITIDVGVRIFKMLVLEMLAPIPVMSYIDPKSSKDGAFANWVKQLTSTFFDLFIKLGLVYLILFFVQELSTDNLFVNYGGAEGAGINPVRKAYLYVFLILGLLKFAKDAPEFIRSIFGIKGKGGEGLSKFAGGALGALTGGAAGAVGGLMTGGLSGAATGLLTGGAAGGAAGAQGKKGGGYRAGADAALQAKTGDPKAKSGMLNKLQQAAAAKQARQAASRIGITEDALDIAQSDMIKKKRDATDAEYAYNEIAAEESAYSAADRVPPPAYTPAVIPHVYKPEVMKRLQEEEAARAAAHKEKYASQYAYQDFQKRKQAAYANWQKKSSDASSAERNYTKGKEIAKKYGIGKSDADKYRSKINGPTLGERARAKGEVYYDKVQTKLGNDTLEQKREDRMTDIAHAGGFNPDGRKKAIDSSNQGS